MDGPSALCNGRQDGFLAGDAAETSPVAFAGRGCPKARRSEATSSTSGGGEVVSPLYHHVEAQSRYYFDDGGDTEEQRKGSRDAGLDESDSWHLSGQVMFDKGLLHGVDRIVEGLSDLGLRGKTGLEPKPMVEASAKAVVLRSGSSRSINERGDIGAPVTSIFPGRMPRPSLSERLAKAAGALDSSAGSSSWPRDTLCQLETLAGAASSPESSVTNWVGPEAEGLEYWSQVERGRTWSQEERDGSWNKRRAVLCPSESIVTFAGNDSRGTRHPSVDWEDAQASACFLGHGIDTTFKGAEFSQEFGVVHGTGMSLQRCSVPRSLATPCTLEASTREGAILRKKLMRLASAVEHSDLECIKGLLPSLQVYADRSGGALNRATYFCLQALVLRLTGTGDAFVKRPPKYSPNDMSNSILWMLRSYPQPTFTGVVTTGMILHKMTGKRNIHIVDMGQSMLPQWPYLIKLLASQPGRPLRHLRFTWLDTSVRKMRWRDRYLGLKKGMEVSKGLQAAALAAGIGFSFEHIALGRDCIHMLYDIRRRPQDTVIFTITYELMFYVREEPKTLLPWMKMMAPDTVAMMELEVETTHKPLVARVKNCFDFFNTVFSSHDACTWKEDQKHRDLLEEVYYGRMIIRLAACTESPCEPCGIKALTNLFTAVGFRKQRLQTSMLEAAHEVARRFPAGFGLSLADEVLYYTWQGAPYAYACSWSC